MDKFSGLTIGLSLIGFVLLAVLLVTLLYRPAKRLLVTCNYKSDSDDKQNPVLIVNMENIGKRKLKLLPPNVRFSHTTHSKLYKVKPEIVNCKFPRMLKIGEKLSCEIDLGHFKPILEKTAFFPTHIKLIVNDFSGLDFESQSLPFKV